MKEYSAINFSSIEDDKFILPGMFYSCTFHYCDFTEICLDTCVFENCKFFECNFSLLSVKHTRFIDVVFQKSKINGVDFSECDRLITEISFLECRVRNCNFSGLYLKKQNFSHSEIIESDFINTELRSSDFSHCLLTGTMFHNCNLMKADFSYAKNYTLNPEGNQLRKAKFTMPEAVALLQHLDIILK